MNVKTKFRDIPFTDTLKCAHNEALPRINVARSGVLWETKSRNQPVMIKTPGSRIDARFACGGPFYETVDAYRSMIVCPHMVEIGD